MTYSNRPQNNVSDPIVDYVEYYRGGGCKILESNISAQRAVILKADIPIFNRENTFQGCYRALVKRA